MKFGRTGTYLDRRRSSSSKPYSEPSSARFRIPRPVTPFRLRRCKVLDSKAPFDVVLLDLALPGHTRLRGPSRTQKATPEFADRRCLGPRIRYVRCHALWRRRVYLEVTDGRNCLCPEDVMEGSLTPERLCARSAGQLRRAATVHRLKMLTPKQLSIMDLRGLPTSRLHELRSRKRRSTTSRNFAQAQCLLADTGRHRAQNRFRMSSATDDSKI